MEWYYASGDDAKGPISQLELDQLVQTGAITDATLVWREGMTNWQPRDIATAPLPPPAAPPMAALSAGEVVCAECGRAFPLERTIRLGQGYICAACKPVALQKVREGIGSGDSEHIREKHLRHEASVKSIGLLYFLSGGLCLLLTVVGFTVDVRLESAIGATVFLVIAAGLIWLGIGLRRLKRWARIAGSILAILSLFVQVLFLILGRFGFLPISLINGCILYLLFSMKGQMVFSDDYKQVIAETPHLKARTSAIVLFLIGAVLMLFAFGVIIAITTRGRSNSD